MVDDVIRAFMVSQGFCLLMATNQDERVGEGDTVALYAISV